MSVETVKCWFARLSSSQSRYGRICGSEGILWHKRLAAIAVFGLMLVGVTELSWGQNIPTGSVVGTIKDAQGAAVPGADITLIKTDTGVSRSTRTSVEGQYLFPNVLPGSYQIKAQVQAVPGRSSLHARPRRR